MKAIVEKLNELGLPDTTSLIADYYYSLVKDVEYNVGEGEESSKLIKTAEDAEGHVTYYKEIKIKKLEVLHKRLVGGVLSTNPSRPNTVNINFRGGYRMFITLENIVVDGKEVTFDFADDIKILDRRNKSMTIDELMNNEDFTKKAKFATFLSAI